MTSFVYICFIIGLVISGTTLVISYKLMGRFLGITLSQWVRRTRRKKDEISAEKLRQVRKQLEILAHDVLKHRLLGLHSLFQEMRPYYIGKPEERRPLTPEQDTAFRDEFFRLCGLKARPEDRLWTRWLDIANTITAHTGKFVTMMLADPMFSEAFRTILLLRQTLVRFASLEKTWTATPKLFFQLSLGKFTSVYPDVLALADACQMVVMPQQAVQNAIEALTAQYARGDVAQRVQFFGTIKNDVLCEAPQKTIVMSLTRILDNALNQSDKAAIDVVMLTDAFTGASSLLFKIYDTSCAIPDESQYGMGMRGVKQNLAAFGGGIQFHRENRGAFKKCAVISIAASPYQPMKVTKLKRPVVFAYCAVTIAQIVIFIGCLLFIIGGPPVHFAGEGTAIIEFSVNVGEQLTIPLCTGGRNVRAEINSANAACTADNCTIASVLESLKPCAKSIKNPKCPGALQWTPQFSDGQRQGRNYELNVHCISEGPPSSEENTRIRILVTRPNCAPRILLVRLFNETRNETHYVQPNQTINTGMTDKLILHVMASDEDADPVTYTLKQPDGKILTSSDGIFPLHPSWSTFATAAFDITASDGISMPAEMRLVLNADKLRPIELQKMNILSSGAAILACEGTSESRICHMSGNNSEITMNLWFDPLQTQIRPIIQFQSADSHAIDVRLIRSGNFHDSTAQIGDQWEFYTTLAHQLTAIVELTNIQKLATPGLYQLTFRLLTNPLINEAVGVNQAINLTVSERSGKIPPSRTLIIFTLSSDKPSGISYNTRHIKLAEYDSDENAPAAAASVWAYSQQANRSTLQPTVTDITCQTPSFADAFEAPVVHSLKSAWRIDFKLKRGCIPGLSATMAGKHRLCSANIAMGGTPALKDDIWILLEDRPCAPHIDYILPTAPENLPDDTLQWRFKIVDADGDLQKQNITVTGAPGHTLQFDSSADTPPGNLYTGTLTIPLSCAAQPTPRIELRATDDTGMNTQKFITPTQACPPLIQTQSAKSLFEVNEGDQIAIGLVYDDDVTPILRSRFGTIQNHSFLWQASCAYGKERHTVEIDAQSKDRAGAPLQFQIDVRCQPRFTLLLDNAPLTTDRVIPIHTGQTRRLTLSGDETAQYRFIPQTTHAIPTLRLSETGSGPDYQLEIQCLDPGTIDTLTIQILPNADNAFPRVSPIQIPVQCLDES